MQIDLNNIKVFIEEDYDKLSKKCAEVIKAQMNSKPDSNIGFATGGTPVGTYKELIRMNAEKEVDFSGITAFNLDEYYPILKSDSQSYDYFMKDNLFNHVNIKKDRLFIPNGEAKDVDLECEEYEKHVMSAGVDLQILGLGLNGHIGFNEPESVFTGKTHHVNLDESTINANARFFNSYEEVPKSALTMGIKTIMMAKKILIMISGENKAEIAEKIFFGDITPFVPASVLQLHPDVTAVLDKEAGSRIMKRI